MPKQDFTTKNVALLSKHLVGLKLYTPEHQGLILLICSVEDSHLTGPRVSRINICVKHIATGTIYNSPNDAFAQIVRRGSSQPPNWQFQSEGGTSYRLLSLITSHVKYGSGELKEEHVLANIPVQIALQTHKRDL